MLIQQEPKYGCDFCGKHQDLLVQLILVGPSNIGICNECVEKCQRIIEAGNKAKSPPAADAGDANVIKAIRYQLGLTQAALADVMGCSQSNVSFHEKGQKVPPDAAKRLIDFSITKGVCLTFDHVYGSAPLPVTQGQGATHA